MTETAEIQSVLFDTHCHLDLTPLGGRVDEVLSAAARSGVRSYLVPGVSPDNWPRIAEMAARDVGVLPAFGLHPMHANSFSAAVLNSLRRLLPQAVAVGEIGLDYLLPGVSRDLQREAFRCQLRLAVESGLPVLIHCRKAFRDLLDIMRQEGATEVGGIMHAFSGSSEIAPEFISLGMYISIAGPVTYANAVRPRLIAERIPLEHLVLETDAPDLSPEPFRGHPNEPAHLQLIAKAVAEIKGVAYEEVARATTANALRLLGWRIAALASG